VVKVGLPAGKEQGSKLNRPKHNQVPTLKIKSDTVLCGSSLQWKGNVCHKKCRRRVLCLVTETHECEQLA